MTTLTRRLTDTLMGRDRRGRTVAIGPSQTGIPITRIDSDRYEAYAELAYRQSGVVFACSNVRMSVFGEIELRWQRIGDRNLFGNPQLALFEQPWSGGTTQDLLERLMLHNDVGGNAFAYRASSEMLNRDIIQLLRPDWVDIMLDKARAEIVGFLYWEGGKQTGERPETLLASEVAHFYTTPDPFHPYKGMSWLTPVLREIESDKQQERHRQRFFENAATPNLLITVEKRIESEEARRRFRSEIDQRFGGWENAYRTLILDDGADAKTIGANMEEIQFTAVQAAGENRICSAARVPPIVVGVKEGLDAATYSNYGQALRAFSHLTIRPMWKKAAGSLQQLVPLPPGALRLWFDDADVSAMREDARDEAEVQQKKAQAIRTLTDAGFTADSAVAAVEANDMGLLQHSGLFSVQLQPPGTISQPEPEEVTI